MSTAARRALYGKLSADTTLTNMLGTPPAGYTKAIYHNQAPEGSAFPFIVFAKNSGRPTETMTDPAAFENEVWLIKAVDRATSADKAETLNARITTLLNDANLSISGATTAYLRRQSDVEYAEIVDSVVFQHVGSLFRLITV